jgi:hypothetical protein
MVVLKIPQMILFYTGGNIFYTQKMIVLQLNKVYFLQPARQVISMNCIQKLNCFQTNWFSLPAIGMAAFQFTGKFNKAHSPISVNPFHFLFR